MKPGRRTDKRGMALVVAILTAFILLALLTSLFWIVAATSRQESYATNATIALNLAEAGLADAIYRLNYGEETYPDTFPFIGSYNPLGGSILTDAANLPLISSLPNLLTDDSARGLQLTGLQGNLNGGAYYVGVIDNGGRATLVAVGEYKGVRRQLKTPLRGLIALGPASEMRPRQDPGQAISEAFNKHAAYCNLFTAGGALVTGNIAYVDNVGSTFPAAPPAGGYWTKTRIAGVEPPLPNRTYFLSKGAEPAPAVPVVTYTDPTGGSGPYPVNNYDPGGGAPVVDIYAGPTFYFENNDVISLPIQVNGSARFLNNAIVGAYTRVTVNAEVGNQSVVRSFLDVAGNVTVSGTPTVENVAGTCIKGNNVTFDPGSLGIRINGGLIKAVNAINIIHTGRNTNPYLANLYAGGSIILEGGSSANQCYLGNTATNVYVVGLGGVTMRGANLRGTCYAQSTIFLGVKNNNVQPISANLPALVMDMWGVGSGELFIQSPGTVHNISGLVYAAGGDSTINASSGTININGPLVADGTVLLSGGVTLNYDPAIFTGVSPAGDIFPWFAGGQRTYLPVWKGWSFK